MTCSPPARRGIRRSGLPAQLFVPRKNSSGVEFGDRQALDRFVRERENANVKSVDARCGLSKASVKEVLDIRSPIDGRVVGRSHHLSVEGARTLVAEAARHVPANEKVTPATRAAQLRKAADIMEVRQGTFMALLASEGGKTIDDGIAEIREAVDFLRFYASEAERLFEPSQLPGPTGEENRLRYRSRGVAVCISPWNFPLAIFTGQVAAALAAGNVVLAKPAEQTPLVASLAIDILHEAGFAKAGLYLAPGNGEAGAALVSHDKTAVVAFTGSTETAFAINRSLAARNAPIAPLIAETGGINALIVDATALPEQVADDVVMSAFRSAGQRCSALRLLYVQEDVADKMIEMIAGAAAELTIGDPHAIATDIGPVIDADQHRMLSEHVERMRNRQKLKFEGRLDASLPKNGHWFAPHIVELDKPESLDREVFGPILHVVRWKAGELDKVCEAIEKTGFGLTLGIHSRIDDVVKQVTERMTVGNIYVNRNIIGAIVGSQPFGGSGLSGTGPKAGGPNYVVRFAREQVVSINTAAAGGNASLIAMES